MDPSPGNSRSIHCYPPDQGDDPGQVAQYKPADSPFISSSGTFAPISLVQFSRLAPFDFPSPFFAERIRTFQPNGSRFPCIEPQMEISAPYLPPQAIGMGKGLAIWWSIGEEGFP